MYVCMYNNSIREQSRIRRTSKRQDSGNTGNLVKFRTNQDPSISNIHPKRDQSIPGLKISRSPARMPAPCAADCIEAQGLLGSRRGG